MLLAAPLLMGAECPFTTDPGEAGGTTSGGNAIDIGGTSGALWTPGYSGDLRVTLRGTNQTASVAVQPDDGPFSLLGRTVDLTSFCWRVDVVCPDQVLRSQTALVQSSASQFLVDFNRKGPLSRLNQQGLVGALQGSQLTVPMGMNASKSEPCTLAVGSAINATATVSDEDATRASTICGLVTLRYSGHCVMLGGNGALLADDSLELALNFCAERL